MRRLPLAVAHRGYSERYPENSRIAFEAAIAAGSDFVETDARLTADGVVICSHDPDFIRLAGDSRRIAETDYTDIREIELASGGKVLRLEDTFPIVAKHARLFIDVKTTDADLVSRIAMLIENHGTARRTAVGLRSAEALRIFRGINRISLCVAMPADIRESADFVDAGADAVRLWEEDFGMAEARAAIPPGVPVWVTTGRRNAGEAAGFTTRERLEHLAAQGAAAVLVNDPSLFEFLREGSRR